MKMKVKVCGMRDPENIRAVAALQPDFLGFIFYPKSLRLLESAKGFPFDLPASICTTGVFVDEKPERILELVQLFQLKAVQLHGQESPEMCDRLRHSGLTVLKALPVAGEDDLLRARDFDGSVDYLVLDTKTIHHGGSGQKFDWQLIDKYKSTLPFLLGGGISSEDVTAIQLIHHPRLAGVDINSRFEDSPGNKNINLVREFINQLNSIRKI